MQKSGAEATVQKQLALLQEDLGRLRQRYVGQTPPQDSTVALKRFKELSPAFDTVAAFTSVLAGNTRFLDEERQAQVMAQLTQLTVAVWHLHLAAAEPLLRRMAESGAPLPIGSRYVFERWVRQIEALEDDEVLYARLPGDKLKAAIAFALELADRSSDLPDFSASPF
jgi:hypothetical protein